MLKFYKPNDFRKLMRILNPDEFLNYMLQSEELRCISGDYSKDCHLLCHNSIGWIVLKLKDTLFEYNSEIIIGSYHGYEHSWLQIGNYYVDLTLAQFESDAPKLAITKVGEVEGYEVGRKMNFNDWLRKEMPALMM